MKKRNKIVLLALGLFAVAGAASSCTANFCTNIEKSRIAFAIEPGASSFIVSESVPTEGSVIKHYEGSNVYQVVLGDETGFKNSAQLTSIISSAKSQGIYIPSDEYLVAIDQVVFDKVIAASGLNISSPDITTQKIKDAYLEYGYLKFYGANDDIFGEYKAINNQLRGTLGYEKAASIDFENFYISTMTSSVDQFRSCITTKEGYYGNYGSYQDTSVKLEAITWGEAWGKGGHLIEGLIVYPVAWLVDTFANIFAGHDSANFLNGVPQLLSLILVTVIVRLFIFLVTIKSTLSQQKMTALQPELAKIQQKYPNSNTNQAQKQRLAEEQMRLYKKNKVNPLSSLLVLIVQFPIFIGVWGAMQGSAVLATGQVLGLHLSDSIWTTLKMGPSGNAGWWTAFVLIILMSVAQFVSMKVPQWIQKARTKKVARLGKNPAQKSQNRTANIISWVMLIMIIIMGFTLPAAMGVYWFVGALVSLAQTLLTQYVFTGKKHKK